MWTRSILKKNAKEQMKGRYWNYLGASLMPILASYVISIPLGIISQIVTSISMATSMFTQNMMDFEYLIDDMVQSEVFDFSVLLEFYSKIFGALLIPMVLLSLVSLIATYMVMIPITVGMNKWYIRSREDKNVSLSLCFSIYKKQSYFKVVFAMLYSALFNFLWFFVLYIPGIVKTYSYRMIPYILADNPGIGAKRALKLSCQMTKGSKFKMFVLDLSFIGWYILGFFACCIGVYAVTPYVYATYAELYDELKKDAVSKGLCTMEELGYVMVINE